MRSGGGDRHLLRHHAAEAHADQRERGPTHVVGQGQSVGGVVGHGVRPGRDLGAAQAPLVGGDGVGRLGERLHQQAGGGQGGARRVEEEQRAPVARAFEVGVDPVQVGGGHGRTLSVAHRRAGRRAFSAAVAAGDLERGASSTRRTVPR